MGVVPPAVVEVERALEPELRLQWVCQGDSDLPRLAIDPDDAPPHLPDAKAMHAVAEVLNGVTEVLALTGSAVDHAGVCPLYNIIMADDELNEAETIMSL